MFVRVFSVLIGIVSLSACNSHTPEINTVCIRDDIGNYILKWETSPPINGTLKLYVSENPGSFNRNNPKAQINIDEGITTYITDDNITRKYFLLSFNDKYYRTVSSRLVFMDSIQNLRDIGGYQTKRGNKTTRWGKIFRSGKVNALSERDTVRLDNLKIKTIIDLRTNEEMANSPITYSKANIVRIPISLGNLENITPRLEEGTIRKGDGIVFMQDLYLQYVANHSGEFAQAMDIFLNKDNYPILFNCTLGKDRVGFLAALLLISVGIPEETVMYDYMLTNDFINLQQYKPLVEQLSYDAQEALTVLLTTNESFLGLALRKIEKDYGSVEKYLQKELNITEKEQNQLKEIILF